MPDLVYYGQYYQNTDTKDAHPLAKHSTYVLGTNSTGFYDGAAIPHQLATKLNHAPTRTQKNSNLPRHANCRIYWIDNTDTNVGQPIIAPLRNIKKGKELLLAIPRLKGSRTPKNKFSLDTIANTRQLFWISARDPVTTSLGVLWGD